MRNRLLYILLTTILLASCQSETIVQVEYDIATLAPMADGVASAKAFVYQDKAYIFGGRTKDGQYQNRLWCYDPQQNEWTDLGQAPMKGRVHPTALVAGDKAYIGLGYNGKIYTDSCYLRDWWAYSFTDNSWERLPDYPANTTDHCIGFATDTALYAGCGFYSNFSSDMYVYNLNDSTWTQIKGSHLSSAKKAFAMASAECDGRYFAGTGYNLKSLNQWMEFTPKNGRFLNRQAMPDKGRDCAVATGGQANIYVFGGQRFGGTMTSLHYYDDIMVYSVATDSWKTGSAMPSGGLVNMVAFTIGKTIYFGLGENINGQINNSLYCFEE